MKPKILILGNGITGITAALTIRKFTSEVDISIISEESPYFFSRTALMYVYMGHMTFRDTEVYERSFYKENDLNLISESAIHVDVKMKCVQLKDGRILPYDFLLIATGSIPNNGWPGEKLGGVQGLYSKQDLELLELNTNPTPKRAVLVGGGLIGIELAEMLNSRGIPVTFLVRENGFARHILPQPESEMVSKEIVAHGIDLRLSTGLREIKGDNGRVTSIVTEQGETIECEFVGLCAGVKPRIDLAKLSNIRLNRGVIVNEFFETDAPHVYAAGDCAEICKIDEESGRVEQLWYTGRKQGEMVGHILARRLFSKPPLGSYQPGIWFNSAKFFSIEYQVYGYVPTHENQMNKDGEKLKSFYYEVKGKNRAIRLVYRASNEEIVGFNLMGIRYRQNVCENWIKEKKSIGFVVDHLGEANFDPEFFRKYEKNLKKDFEKQRRLLVS